MPKGPQGQKRYADVIGNAVHIMRIATGVAEERCGKVARSLTYTATTLARALEWLRPDGSLDISDTKRVATSAVPV
jgi:hypothetical protein